MKFLKGIVDSEVAGENILEAQLKIYTKTRAACPGDDPHILLAKVYMSRLRARRVDVSDMSVMNKCFSEMLFPACLDEGFNIRAAAIIIMKDERPDIIANFPKFEWQLESFLSPLFERLERGERLLNVYNEKNPVGQISREFPQGYLALQALSDDMLNEIAGGDEVFGKNKYNIGTDAKIAFLTKTPRPVNKDRMGLDLEPAMDVAAGAFTDNRAELTNEPDIKTELENFPQAMMAIQYRPEVEAAWSKIQDLPEELQRRFLENLDTDPTVDPVVLSSELEAEHLKLMRPYDDEFANDALEDVRTIGDDAEREFNRAYGLFSTTIPLDEIIQRVEAKFGPTERTRREQEAKEREWRVAQEHARQEAKERAERKAKERAQEEAKERAEREAEEQAERDRKERAEREAKDRAEREAKEQTEREARAQRDARDRAVKEWAYAKEQAKQEATEQAEREAKRQARQRTIENWKHSLHGAGKRVARAIVVLKTFYFCFTNVYVLLIMLSIGLIYIFTQG